MSEQTKPGPGLTMEPYAWAFRNEAGDVAGFRLANLGQPQPMKGWTAIPLYDAAAAGPPREPTDADCMAMVHAATVHARRTFRDPPDLYDHMKQAARWAINAAPPAASAAPAEPPTYGPAHECPMCKGKGRIVQDSMGMDKEMSCHLCGGTGKHRNRLTVDERAQYAKAHAASAAPANQCDGCMRDLPLDGDYHTEKGALLIKNLRAWLDDPEQAPYAYTIMHSEVRYLLSLIAAAPGTKWEREALRTAPPTPDDGRSDAEKWPKVIGVAPVGHQSLQVTFKRMPTPDEFIAFHDFVLSAK